MAVRSDAYYESAARRLGQPGFTSEDWGLGGAANIAAGTASGIGFVAHRGLEEFGRLLGSPIRGFAEGTLNGALTNILRLARTDLHPTLAEIGASFSVLSPLDGGVPRPNAPYGELLRLSNALKELLRSEVGESEAIIAPIPDEHRASLQEFVDFVDGIPAETPPEDAVSLEGRAELLRSTLSTLHYVFSNNVPKLIQAKEFLQTILEDILRKANGDCLRAKTLIEAVLRTHSLSADDKETLLRHLTFITEHPALFGGTTHTTEEVVALKASLEADEPLDFDRLDVVRNQIDDALQVQSGELERAALLLRARIFDPESGILKEATDALLGPRGVVSRTVDDAPPSLRSSCDALIPLLRNPVPQKHLARGYFSALEYYFNAHKEAFLGRALETEEKTHIREMFRATGKRVLSGELQSVDFRALKAILAPMRDSIRDRAPLPSEIDRDRFIGHIDTVLAVDEGEAESFEISDAAGVSLRNLAQYMTVCKSKNLLTPQVVDGLRALEVLGSSENVVHLTHVEKSLCIRLHDALHAAVIERAGAAYGLFHNLKRDLLNPEHGVLPQFIDEYFRDVGADATRVMHELSLLEGTHVHLDRVRQALHHVEDLQLRFETLLHRPQTAQERADIVTISEILRATLDVGNASVLEGRMRAFSTARGRLASAFEQEQGIVQRHVVGLVHQVEGMVDNLTGRIDRMTHTLPQDHLLFQLRSGMRALRESLHSDLEETFATDKEELTRVVETLIRNTSSNTDKERVLGRPHTETALFSSSLRRLSSALPGIRFPESPEEKRDLLSYIDLVLSQTQETIESHRHYSDLQRGVDGLTGTALRAVDDASAVFERRIRGVVGGGLPSFGTGAAAPRPPAARPARASDAAAAGARDAAAEAPPLEAGSLGTLCGGLFSGAMHYLHSAAEAVGTFSLGSFAGFVNHHLRTTVTDYVQEYRDLDQTHREEILGVIATCAERLEAAQEEGIPAYLQAMQDAAARLSRYELLINGASILPAFDEVYTSEQLREDEMRVARAERISREAEAPTRPAKIRVNEAKEELKDMAGMYTTFMYVYGTRIGGEDRTQRIDESIHNVIAADLDFIARSPRGTREYQARFDELKASRIGEYARAEEDPTLRDIMQAVSNADTPAERPAVFKRELCRIIDRRDDISWLSKIWIKNVSIPLAMTFVPFFVGRTFDNALWKIRVLIHNVTNSDGENPITVVDPKIIREISNFLTKYRQGIDTWASSSIGRTRDEALEHFLLSTRQNNGWKPDEVYDNLGDLLVTEFFADSSVADRPGALASTYWESATTAPFSMTPLGIVGNIVAWPLKFAGYTLASCTMGVGYLGALGVQSVWNAGSRFVMRKVVMNTQLVEQLSTTAKNSLYNEAYMTTLNRLLMKQLREGHKKLREIEKDTETEKNLQLAPRVIDNEAAPRREALEHLSVAWNNLKTKLPAGDERLETYERMMDGLRGALNEEGALVGIDTPAFNSFMHEFSKELWKLHNAFKKENVNDKFPEKTRDAVAELIEQFIVVLDKRAPRDPGRAREGGIAETVQNAARAVAVDHAADSVANLLLLGCQTLFEGDFLEEQLATALEESVKTMLFEAPPNDPDQELEHAAIERAATHYLNLIIESVVNTTIDGAPSALKDAKLKPAKELIDWIKISFSDGVGLRCDAPTLQKNVTTSWTEKMREYREAGDVEKLREMHRELSALLTELTSKGSQLVYDTSLTLQMKRQLGEARDAVARALGLVQDELEPVLVRADAERLSEQVSEHTTSVRNTLHHARDQLVGITRENLRTLEAVEIERLHHHADAADAAIAHIDSPEPRLQTRFQAAEAATAHLRRFKSRILSHRAHVERLEALRAQVGQFADARRRGLLERGRAHGAAEEIAANVSGGLGEANLIRRRIEETLSLFGESDGLDRERLEAALAVIQRARTAEDVNDARAAFTEAVNALIDADTTTVIEEKEALTRALSQSADRIDSYNVQLERERGGEDAPDIAGLVEGVERRIAELKTCVDGLKYPPQLNANLVDLSPGSGASTWIKAIVYSEMQRRGKQALSMTRDEVVFKGAVHHAAGSIVRSLADPSEVRRRNQWVEEVAAR